MNKILHIIKLLLLVLFVILNLVFWNRIKFVESGPFFFAVIMGLFAFLLLKDMIKKNKIIYNKSFNILTIVVLIIINIIFIRALTDNHFLFNNIPLQGKIDEFTNMQYGYTDGYDDSWEMFSYMNQNMKFFILIIILLLAYRKINVEKKD